MLLVMVTAMVRRMLLVMVTEEDEHPCPQEHTNVGIFTDPAKLY